MNCLSWLQQKVFLKIDVSKWDIKQPCTVMLLSYPVTHISITKLKNSKESSQTTTTTTSARESIRICRDWMMIIAPVWFSNALIRDGCWYVDRGLLVMLHYHYTQLLYITSFICFITYHFVKWKCWKIFVYQVFHGVIKKLQFLQWNLLVNCRNCRYGRNVSHCRINVWQVVEWKNA